ncbi:MAG: transposase [Ignavibacteriales bacterium]|nr:transposase [Ignavibacteriales bacterium]
MKYESEKYYHIYNRGANKEEIFFFHENYRYCLRLLEKYATKYKVVVLAYCLMPNHYHFMLRQSLKGSVQRCIQTLFNSYTQALNKEQHRSGTLFEGRAKTREVDSDLYAVQLCAYIHLNPVAAQLVSKPNDWEFSDYNIWISTDEPNKPCEGSNDLRKGKIFTDLSLRNLYFDDGETYKRFVEEQHRIKTDEKFECFLLD